MTKMPKDKPEGYIFGAPTKYRKKYCDMLVDHMANGYSFESFAGVIGVTRSTIYEWLKHHPHFSDAKNIGTQKSQLFWERIGVHGTIGKLKGWAPAGWIFNMKNRFGWQDRKEDPNDMRIQTVRIELPDSKTEQVISIEPGRIEGSE